MKKILACTLAILMLLSLAACGGPRAVSNQSFSLEHDGILMPGKYTGTMSNKLPNGTGAFSYEDPIKGLAISFSGEWVDGVPSVGELVYSGFPLEYEGKTLVGTYSGESFNLLPHGKGSFSLDDDAGYFNYTGEWADGKISGTGELSSNFYVVHFSDVDRTGTYDGEVLNCKASGNGVFSASTDDGYKYTYTGEWKNGLYNGHGLVKYEDPGPYTMDGNFKNGDFSPAPVEYFTAIGTSTDCSYEIIDNAEAFIKNNPDIFLNNSIEGTELEVNTAFNYDAFSKNPNQYNDGLISVPGLKVIQIFEENYWNADHTLIIAKDSQYRVYYINMYGFAEGVYDNDVITLVGMPLSYFTYPDVSDTLIWAIAVAAVSVT